MECSVPVTDEQQEEAELRPRDPRTNTLLSVSVDMLDGSASLRVRDVSSSGALLEGSVLPVPGEAILVHRHDRALAARVIWTKGSRCGIRFERAIDVAWFISRGKHGTAPAHQARIDAIQARLRAPGGVATVFDTEAGVPPSSPAHEIAYAMKLIDNLVDALTADAEMLGRHGTALQKIDVAQQALQRAHKALAKG